LRVGTIGVLSNLLRRLQDICPLSIQHWHPNTQLPLFGSRLYADSLLN
jgi:hypothetical protein